MAAVLHYLRWQFRIGTATTETSRHERDVLARLAQDRKQLVEIGVAQGVTTKRLRSAMAPDGELWAVDPYYPNRLGLRFSELIAHGEVGAVEGAQVRWLRCTGAAAAAVWTSEKRPPPELVFIDGDHSWQGVSSDWEAWSPLLSPGGLIALHDSRPVPRFPVDADSVRFTQAVVLTDPRFSVIEELESLTVVERKA